MWSPGQACTWDPSMPALLKHNWVCFLYQSGLSVPFQNPDLAGTLRKTQQVSLQLFLSCRFKVADGSEHDTAMVECKKKLKIHKDSSSISHLLDRITHFHRCCRHWSSVSLKNVKICSFPLLLLFTNPNNFTKYLCQNNNYKQQSSNQNYQNMYYRSGWDPPWSPEGSTCSGAVMVDKGSAALRGSQEEWQTGL